MLTERNVPELDREYKWKVPDSPEKYKRDGIMRVLPRAEVAQLVEHSTENAGVTGSIPVLGTNSYFTFTTADVWNFLKSE
jgi:hypothetical protein